MSKATRKIAVLDFETDPFEYGHVPEPFVSGFYDGATFTSIWDESECASKTVAMLERTPERTIYAHNGGRFDYFYLLPYLSKDLQIINSRIVRGNLGKHEIRDSFSIMPFGLAAYKKDDFDYEKMRKERREKYHAEIIHYLRNDCIYLFELVSQFVAEFGSKLTVGSAALKELRKFHRFGCGTQNYDAQFRKSFYFGGRNQVFRAGKIQGPLELYDVNSMYPYVMKNCLHPLDSDVETYDREIGRTCFLRVTGKQVGPIGAFPTRTESGSLDFTRESGEFCVSIHEWQTALEFGMFKPDRVIRTYNWRNRGSFDVFIDHFYDARLKAEAEGDKLHKLFYKYILNSAYGKFAQNPENFFDWQILSGAERPEPWHDLGTFEDPMYGACSECLGSQPKPACGKCHNKCIVTEGEHSECSLTWTPAYFHDCYTIWQRPVQMQHFYNITIGASITGAARAHLLRGLHYATDPCYCDTDSILCKSLPGLSSDPKSLGSWKLECTCSHAVIAGKKLYALFDAGNKCIKQANKGSKITAAEIEAVTQGQIVTWRNPVPSFRLDGKYTFISRRIRRTAS